MNETVIIFAARYAHTRNTAAAAIVVSHILEVWDELSDIAKYQLYKESFEARYCQSDWDMLKYRFKRKLSTDESKPKEPEFDGAVYDPKYDKDRLTKQLGRVYACMSDGVWRTLDEISNITGDPHASISAQLRHLRKPRFGSYVIEKRPRGERKSGLWEYQLKQGG